MVGPNLDLHLPAQHALLFSNSLKSETHQFTVTKLCNQPRSPPMSEWIKRMWNIYTMEFCSSIKKNEIMYFLGTR
jgi:hypothetical protein